MTTQHETSLPAHVLDRFRLAARRRDDAEQALLLVIAAYQDAEMPTTAERYGIAVELAERARRLMDACREWSLSDGHVVETLDWEYVTAQTRVFDLDNEYPEPRHTLDGKW